MLPRSALSILEHARGSGFVRDEPVVQENTEGGARIELVDVRGGAHIVDGKTPRDVVVCLGHVVQELAAIWWDAPEGRRAFLQKHRK